MRFKRKSEWIGKTGLKDRHMLSVIVVLGAIIIALGLFTYKRDKRF